MKAPPAASEWTDWRRTRRSAVTACSSAKDQRSEAGLRCMARTSRTVWSSGAHTKWIVDPHWRPSHIPARQRGSMST
eukprot:10502045-Alexandrium_andersonii.AAC.1